MSTTKLEPLRGPPGTGGQTMNAVVQTRYGPSPEDLLRVAEIDRPFDRTIRAMMLSPFVGQTLVPLASSENAAVLKVLTELIESGEVTPVVDRIYPLEKAAAAIRHMLDGKARGKLVVSVSPGGMHTPPGSTP
jgi:hypothetical protein